MLWSVFRVTVVPSVKPISIILSGLSPNSCKIIVYFSVVTRFGKVDFPVSARKLTVLLVVCKEIHEPENIPVIYSCIFLHLPCQCFSFPAH